MKKENRLVSYVTDDLYAQIKNEAKALGMTESTFVRFVVLQYLKGKKNDTLPRI